MQGRQLVQHRFRKRHQGIKRNVVCIFTVKEYIYGSYREREREKLTKWIFANATLLVWCITSGSKGVEFHT